MSDTKPRPPNAGKGRPKGTPNKVTGELKEMILGALDEAGGQKYLVQQAAGNPTAFLALLGRVLPRQVDATLEATVRQCDVSAEPLSMDEWDRRYGPEPGKL